MSFLYVSIRCKAVRLLGRYGAIPAKRWTRPKACDIGLYVVPIMPYPWPRQHDTFRLRHEWEVSQRICRFAPPYSNHRVSSIVHVAKGSQSKSIMTSSAGMGSDRADGGAMPTPVAVGKPGAAGVPLTEDRPIPAGLPNLIFGCLSLF